ncbi:hypothetical protein THAOC_01005 [Thalassiosira oceanica]|uniref:Helicase-associated domain-containing protein n=1 Tax=Thalassiosira oceanica TaxID=159749 RepID=K0TNJ8_THAOC|nr:hypothetical protein THAOC_01005 [Thalassiosira oceanica]|eukprot:EJK77181.1 hypothetical protein THAOC_01005 [Thalassiosira oceanica]
MSALPLSYASYPIGFTDRNCTGPPPCPANFLLFCSTLPFQTLAARSQGCVEGIAGFLARQLKSLLVASSHQLVGLSLSPHGRMRGQARPRFRPAGRQVRPSQTLRLLSFISFRRKHTTANTEGQGELGRWVKNQRSLFKNNNLVQTRIDLLRSIDFEWSLNGDATVRTNHLSVADSINDEFIGDEDVEEVRAVQGMNDGEPLVPRLPPMRLLDVLDGDRDWGWA